MRMCSLCRSIALFAHRFVMCYIVARTTPRNIANIGSQINNIRTVDFLQ
jgi:hypothetical protein